MTGGTVAKPIEAGAIEPHAQAQTSGDAEGAVDPLHLRLDRLEGDLAAPGFLGFGLGNAHQRSGLLLREIAVALSPKAIKPEPEFREHIAPTA